MTLPSRSNWTDYSDYAVGVCSHDRQRGFSSFDCYEHENPCFCLERNDIILLANVSI